MRQRRSPRSRGDIRKSSLPRTSGTPMLLDPVSGTEMQAARALSGAALALIIASPLLRSWARPVRIATTVSYIVAIVALVLYHAW
jgi:hypothetical protein